MHLFHRYYGSEPLGTAAGHLAPVAFLAGNDRLGRGSRQPSPSCHSVTKPHTPQLATKGRSRLVCHPSREEVEAKELEEIKRLDACFVVDGSNMSSLLGIMAFLDVVSFSVSRL